MSNLHSSSQADNSLEPPLTSDLFDLEEASPTAPPNDEDHPFDDWVDAIDDPDVANDVEISPAAGGTEGPTSPTSAPSAMVPVTADGARFAPQHVEYLRKRAIDLDLAWSEGVRSLDEAEAKRYSRCKNLVGGGLAFPYGHVLDPYTRVQLDDREHNTGKTRCPHGVTPPPYIPDSVAVTGDEPLFIVEAPAKALAMASNGFRNTIGCGGVDAGIFESGSSKLQAVLLPFLRSSRPVVIVFDAGRAKNARVARAEARIARALLDHGCRVSLVALPQPDESGDGPDDFLARVGEAEMRKLVDCAAPADPVEWARALVAAGPAIARQALELLPFVAAIVAGGPGAAEGVARELHDYISKRDITAACRKFESAVQAKRAESSGRQEPGHAPAGSGSPGGLVLLRGDEVELANEHMSRFGGPAVFADGATYRYAGGAWKEVPDAKQRRALGSLAGTPVVGGDKHRPLNLSDQKIRGALAHFQDLIAQPDFFARTRAGLCFENGFLRLEDSRLELVGHDADYRARHRYPFAFDRAAPCPKWTAYLESVWQPDLDRADKVRALQEFVGATLFGCMPRYKTALMLFGDSDSGKSTCLDVLRGLVPANAACAINLHDFEHEYNRAHLAGKLLNLVAEVPSAELVRSEAFKAIIAGDRIRARNVCERPFDFAPVAAHVFAANTLPHVSDRSEGVWTRWLVLSFNQTFSRKGKAGAAVAEVDLAKKILADEIPAIVAWAVAGFERLLGNGGMFTRPASSEEVLADWRRESNPVALFFDEELVLNPAGSMTTGELYEGYKSWCDRNGFHKPVSHPSFGKMLHSLFRERSGRKDFTRLLHGKTIFVGVSTRRPIVAGRDADYSLVLS